MLHILHWFTLRKIFLKSSVLPSSGKTYGPAMLDPVCGTSLTKCRKTKSE